MPQGIADRVVEDLHVGEQFQQRALVLVKAFAQVLDSFAQLGDTQLELGAILIGNGDARGRHRADLFGDIVSWTVGEQRHSRQQQSKQRPGAHHRGILQKEGSIGKVYGAGASPLPGTG